MKTKVIVTVLLITLAPATAQASTHHHRTPKHHSIHYHTYTPKHHKKY